MPFWSSTITILQAFLAAFGVGMGLLGGINFFEGQATDNPATKQQGIRQLISGCGITALSMVVVPILASMF